MVPSKSFKELVLEVVRKIPKGETRSYARIATMVGNQKAARAVARIMSQNYDPTVPCHRVIRADGTLGGYNRGGQVAKALLLRNESR